MPIKIDHIVVGIFQENTYFLIAENKNTIIIDPGGDGHEILEYMNKNRLNPVMIINTHGHPDHIEANDIIKEKFDIPIYIHPDDAEFFDVSCDKHIRDGDEIEFEGEKLKILHTPGHTMGSICIMGNGFMITGDTIFAGSIGRTDLGGDTGIMKETLKSKFNGIPGDTILYPGHGPSTTLKHERMTNPFITSKAKQSQGFYKDARKRLLRRKLLAMTTFLVVTYHCQIRKSRK